MNTETQPQPSLSNKSIWLIDDSIPLSLADFDHEEMLKGNRPIDRGTLLSLLHHIDETGWSDQRVRALCQELAKEAGDVKAFIQPGSAVDHLRTGAKAPDVVVFDMDYKTLDKIKVQNFLETILKECISVVQIYTVQASENISADLESLKERYSTRLQPPLQKSQINAERLAEIISQKVENSLSAQLALNIRRLSTLAIEDVLVKIDDLPLDVAIRLLAGKEEEKLNDVELIELLSGKVADYLKSSKELSAAIHDYAQKSGVPAGKEKQFADTAVDLIASVVSNNIQYDKLVYNAIRSAKQQVSANEPDDKTEGIVKKFFAFRVYDQPGDEIVRTGDIVNPIAENQSDEYPDLYMILTPACDLAHFWTKTRGTLIMIKMYPVLKDRGIDRVHAYDHKIGDQLHSITSKNPFVLPSLSLPNREPMDYVVFVHEIEHRKFDGVPLTNGIEQVKERKKKYDQPLTYTELNKIGINIQRQCRVSEPFLRGVLSEIRNFLFRDGVPDFPDEEEKRLLACFKQNN